MAKYRQISTFHEDGYGEVTVLFAISDEYAEMFSLADAVDVDVFALKASRKDLDLKEGIQAEDELEFEIDESAADTQDGLDAVAFTLAAQDRSVRRYVLVAVNPADEDAPEVSECEFIGLVRPSMQGTDIAWHDGEWGSAQTPLRRWQASAGHMSVEIFERVRLRDLIFGNQDLGIPDVMTGWEQTAGNVEDRTGYFKGVAPPVAYEREARYVSICSLNDVLETLAGNLSTALDSMGHGVLSITLVDSPLGVALSPARMKSAYGGTSWRSRYCVAGGGPYLTPAFVVKQDDAVECRFGSGVDEDYQIWISYCLVKPDHLESPPGSDAGNYSFAGDNLRYDSAEQFETFASLLYGIAYSFGAVLQFDWQDPQTINISVISRAAVKKHRMYIRDVGAADLDTAPLDPAEDDKQYTARAMGLASEGPLLYYYDDATKSYRQMPSNNNGERLPLSISPTIRMPSVGFECSQTFNSPQLPHNCLWYDGGSPISSRREWNDTKGITTAIYLRTRGNGEYGLTEQDVIWEPAADVSVDIDGYSWRFSKLASYVNHITLRDGQYYETEYELTVPYLCSFRKSADGTHQDDDGGRGRWQNLVLGCAYWIDGDEYVVVGIERSLSRPSVKLRLHRASRFALAPGAGPEADAEGPQADAPTVVDYGNLSYKERIAGDAFLPGDCVYVGIDARVYRAAAVDGCYGKLFGMAASVGAEDEPCIIITAGIVENANYSFLPGGRVYLRNAVLGEPNVSNSPLQARSSEENYFVRLGTAETEHSFLINIDRQLIYPPKFEV